VVGVARGSHSQARVAARRRTDGQSASTQATEIMELFRELNREGTTIVQDNAFGKQRSLRNPDSPDAGGWLVGDTANPSQEPSTAAVNG